MELSQVLTGLKEILKKMLQDNGPFWLAQMSEKDEETGRLTSKVVAVYLKKKEALQESTKFLREYYAVDAVYCDTDAATIILTGSHIVSGKKPEGNYLLIKEISTAKQVDELQFILQVANLRP